MEEFARKIAIFTLPVLFGITFHEVAHGYAAKQIGDDTAESMGRLSLNPLRHVDPVGTVLLPLILLVLGSGIVFGYAKPVPINPSRFRNVKKGIVRVAAAGPASNFMMALIAGALFRVIIFLFPGVGEEIVVKGIYASAGSPAEYALIPLGLMLAVAVEFNVLLCIFNLIPIPPLDGGRILSGLLPPHLEQKFALIERYGMIVLIVLLFFDPFGIMSRFFGSLMFGLSTLILGISI